jgi:hypothetical protein
VRDEIEHFARTAESLIAQEHRPVRWVVVDDGSTDGTRALAESYAAAHDWITVVGSGDEAGARARGGKIVRAFKRGQAEVTERHDVIVKLDADLFLPAHYFRWVMRVFADVPRAGVVGGVALVHDGSGWRGDTGLQTAVNGVAKAYRAACLEDMGGLPESMGWDGIDEFSARARGWTVHVLPELQLLHYRWRGRAQRWTVARWEEGRANHYMGYRWDFMLFRVAYRSLVERPPVLASLVTLTSFAWARLRRRPQIPDAKARELLRREQGDRMRALLRGRLAEPTPPLPHGGPGFTETGRSDAGAGETA